MARGDLALAQYRRAVARTMVLGSRSILEECIARLVNDDGHEVAAVVVLFSGGNDSTVMSHIFKGQADYALHCNTGIGIEQTRQFVRDTCARWQLPLIELKPRKGRRYVDHVLEFGFPGPGNHGTVYWKLKNDAIRRCTAMLNPDPRKYRVVYIGGRRRSESKRREKIPLAHREGSAVFIDVLANWTALDLNAYRRVHPRMPHNEVTDMLHMSGECLCGAYAQPGELEEIGFWFPGVKEKIEKLEHRAQEAGVEYCTWGWAKRGNCDNGCNI